MHKDKLSINQHLFIYDSEVNYINHKTVSIGRIHKICIYILEQKKMVR